MIDTFNFSLTDLEISGANLIIETPNYNHSTGELEPTYDLFRDTRTGKMVNAKKAYLNHPKFTFEIRPNHFQNDLNLIQNRPDLTTIKRINVSIPRYARGRNTYPVSVKEFQGVLTDLEYTLRENGIKTNINNGEVGRVDICKMVNTNYEFSNYLNVLSLLDFKRLDKNRDYGTTLLSYNNQRQYAIYDKIEEEIIKAKREKRKDYNPNQKHQLMRFEYRLLKSKSVKSQIGFTSVKEFPKNYDQVERAFYEYSLTTFGKEPENVTSLLIEDFRTGLLDYKQRGIRNPIEQFILHHISLPEIETSIGTEKFVQLVKETFNRQAASDWKRKIRKATKEVELSKLDSITKESYVSLYKEIKTKLLMRVV